LSTSSKQKRKRDVGSRPRKMGTGVIIGALIVVGVAALAVIFALNNGGDNKSTAAAGAYPFQVGTPGSGTIAPEFKLHATDGSTFDLAAERGHMVLLYFQEGVGCQPCWDQLKDIQKDIAPFRTLGIEKILTITTNSLADLRQKVADEGITSPVLSDPDVSVSRAYQANLYGMMGDSQDGHSFLIIDPAGRIKWRADYGGAPKFTMYVPVQALLADIRKGLGLAPAASSS
jgi:peroxiredoxin